MFGPARPGPARPVPARPGLNSQWGDSPARSRRILSKPRGTMRFCSLSGSVCFNRKSFRSATRMCAAREAAARVPAAGIVIAQLPAPAVAAARWRDGRREPGPGRPAGSAWRAGLWPPGRDALEPGPAPVRQWEAVFRLEVHVVPRCAQATLCVTLCAAVGCVGVYVLSHALTRRRGFRLEGHPVPRCGRARGQQEGRPPPLLCRDSGTPSRRDGDSDMRCTPPP